MNQNEADSYDMLTVFKDCMLEYSRHTWVIGSFLLKNDEPRQRK